MNNLNDQIESINGFNVLTITIPPNNSVIIEPSNMIHMNGKLIVEPIVQSKHNTYLSKLGTGIKRAITGDSFFDNQISNYTNENLEISIGSLFVGGILKIEVKKDEVWRFTPSSFLACSNNLVVSGNVNILKNFKGALGGQSLLYTEVSLKDRNSGTVWISSYGAIQKHELKMGENSEKLYINDGNFLGMLSFKDKINYWDKFVNVGSANGFLKGLLTKTALLLKIEDKKSLRENNDKKCIVYTQSLNMRNLNNHIAGIAIATVPSGSGIHIDLFGGNKEKYEKYEEKYNNLLLKE
jgi:uncharacterized protein (AIM24 family)